MPNSQNNKLIVFSDLDGTLLDHDTYDWQPARPALGLIKARGIPLVLVSSKTLAELADYRQQLELDDPVVAENGAAIDVPAGYFPESEAVPASVVTRAELQSAYEDVKRSGGYRCEAFYELGVPGIVRETGLDEAQAARANDRLASEPILWLDSGAKADAFGAEMKARGLRCVRGGRFLHLMADTGKEAAVRVLLDAYSKKYADSTLTSVSLGDGPNDLGMLAVTDVAVVIPGKHEHAMVLASGNRILRPASPGPAGWNEALLTLLEEHTDERSTTRHNGD